MGSIISYRVVDCSIRVFRLILPNVILSTSHDLWKAKPSLLVLSSTLLTVYLSYEYIGVR